MRFNLGRSCLNANAAKRLNVSLPKDVLEVMGLYAGMELECVGYNDPVEIIIKPLSNRVGEADELISTSIERRPWGLRGKEVQD
jgi:hypothetical protein